MSKKRKPFPTCAKSLSKLVEDVPAGNFKVYDVPSFPAQLNVLPDRYLDKCSQIIVATSGSPSEGIDWMVICGLRVDGNKQERDIDPAIVLLDSESLAPGPSGLIGYHQDYSGRTVPITGAYDWNDYEGTVTQLRSEITVEFKPLELAPSEVLNSLNHMVQIVRLDSDFPKPNEQEEREEQE